jgi:hypothetical protein
MNLLKIIKQDRTASFRNIMALVIILTLIVLTRGHYNWLIFTYHLPDFTIAALFIAGVYLRNFLSVFLIILSAVIVDNYSILYLGVEANCITPAYSLLLLTYFGIFYLSKYLTTLVINKNFIRNFSLIIVISSVQWFLATLSYYLFTDSALNKLGSYMLYWSVKEIPITLSWMVIVMLVFTINHNYSLVNYFYKNKSLSD